MHRGIGRVIESGKLYFPFSTMRDYFLTDLSLYSEIKGHFSVSVAKRREWDSKPIASVNTRT